MSSGQHGARGRNFKGEGIENAFDPMSGTPLRHWVATSTGFSNVRESVHPTPFMHINSRLNFIQNSIRLKLLELSAMSRDKDEVNTPVSRCNSQDLVTHRFDIQK